MNAEFDRHADAYEEQHSASVRASGETPDYFARYKVDDVAKAAPDVRRILDFGAGIGASVPHWRRAFPSAALTCLDVSARSLEIARARHGGSADYLTFDGTRIPLSDGSFDLVFAACVFHHIDAPRHVALLAELRRVLCQGGQLFVYEHNPLNPLTRQAVERCPFDVHAVLIGASTMRRRVLAAGFTKARIAHRLFFPHALRTLRPFERWLERVPLGAQYCVKATR